MIVRPLPLRELIGRKAEKKQLLNKAPCQLCSSGMLTCRNSGWVFGENTALLVFPSSLEQLLLLFLPWGK